MKKYNIIIFICLSFFIIFSFSDFYSQTSKILIASTLNHLNDISHHTYSNYNHKYENLKNEILSTGHLFSVHFDNKNDQRKILNNIEDNKGLFKRIWYINSDRDCYNYKLDQYIEFNDKFLDEIFKGKTDISEIFHSPYNQEDVFSVYTPITHDDQIVGGLLGIVEVDEFFNESLYQGNTDVFMSDTEGNIISQSQDGIDLKYGDNCFEFLNKNVNYIKGNESEIKTNIEQMRSGYIVFEYNDIKRVCYYEPSPIENWYIFSVSSEEELKSNNNFINDNTYLLIVKISFAFIIIFSLIAYYLMRINKKNKMINKKLNDSHKKIEMILKLTSDRIFEYNINEDVLTLPANENNSQIVLKDFIKNIHEYDFVTSEFEGLFIENINELINGQDMVFMNGQFPYISSIKDKWYHLSMIRVHDTSMIIGTFKDYTDEMNQYQNLLEDRLYKNSIYANAIYMFCLNIKTRKIVIFQENGVYNHNYNYDYENEFISQFMNNVYVEDQEIVKEYLDYNRIVELSNDYKNTTIEFRLRNNDNDHYHWVKFSIQFEQLNNEPLMIAYGNNINDEKMKQLEMEYNANIDEMTGLYNRQTFRRKVNEYLNNSRLSYQYNAYMVIDLDNFKLVNDNLGHLAGDSVLIEVADILKNEFNHNSYIGRFGGDEFVIFTYNEFSFASIEKKVNNVLENIKNISIKDGYVVTASIGICFVSDEKTSTELFEKCDKALYECKKLNKNSFKIFNK